jgi:hypothetical protein
MLDHREGVCLLEALDGNSTIFLAVSMGCLEAATYTAVRRTIRTDLAGVKNRGHSC